MDAVERCCGGGAPQMAASLPIVPTPTDGAASAAAAAAETRARKILQGETQL